MACGIYGIDPITVPCEVYEEASHPGLFKIKGFQLPLVAAIFEASEEELAEYEGVYWRNSEIIIDAQNAADVRIALQDYGVCLNTSDGFIDGITNVYKDAPFSVGTYENGVIAFPTAKGMLATIGGEGYYYANQNGAFKIVLPAANASVPAAAPVNFDKNTKAAKVLYKAREDNFERVNIQSASATVTKIAHKAKKASREVSNNDKF